MEKEKPISFEDKKAIQLEMLKEIDTFCRSNDIRYSLAFGTLLGAVRHKGFIPWDDDVDIMMPLPDMLRFKDLFHSDNLKYCDVDTEKHFEYPFSRIVHTRTYDQNGLFKNYGICIDTYPIVTIPLDKKQQEIFFFYANKLAVKSDWYRKWKSRINRYLSFSSIPGYDTIQKKYRNYILNSNQPYGSTGCYYAVAGPLRIRQRTTYDRDLFNQLIDLEFESNLFCCVKEYDYFLKLMYGDYMTPPPEDQRHPYHRGNYYWK